MCVCYSAPGKEPWMHSSRNSLSLPVWWLLLELGVPLPPKPWQKLHTTTTSVWYARLILHFLSVVQMLKYTCIWSVFSDFNNSEMCYNYYWFVCCHFQAQINSFVFDLLASFSDKSSQLSCANFRHGKNGITSVSCTFWTHRGLWIYYVGMYVVYMQTCVYMQSLEVWVS